VANRDLIAARDKLEVLARIDPLFRWGGDEFLILCFNISEAAASKRITEMDASLAFTSLPGASEPVRLIVSYGLAAFSGSRGIETAIDQVDEAMYASKQARKRSGKLAG